MFYLCEVLTSVICTLSEQGKKLPPEKEEEDTGEVSEEDEAEDIDESGGKKPQGKKSPEPSAPVSYMWSVCMIPQLYLCVHVLTDVYHNTLSAHY